MKPMMKIVAGRPVVLHVCSDAVTQARKRHGKPFSHEPGSNWKPHEVPVLTQWLQSRGKKI